MAKKRKWKRKTRTKSPRAIRVESGAVYIVPFPFVRSYYAFEIEDEGFHRSDCHPVVLLPRHEAGPATREWVETIFAAMDEVRRVHPRQALETPGLSPLGGGVDVGLLDIPATVRGPLELVTANLKDRPMEVFEANLFHIDSLLADTFHDQMTLVTVPHMARPDGTPEFHYHNLVFGVRREFRAGRTIIGPLDLKPMLETLAQQFRLQLRVVTQP
jgi:hypothetical protein